MLTRSPTRPQALTRLEVGQVAVVRFGTTADCVLPFERPYTADIGPEVPPAHGPHTMAVHMTAHGCAAAMAVHSSPRAVAFADSHGSDSHSTPLHYLTRHLFLSQLLQQFTFAQDPGQEPPGGGAEGAGGAEQSTKGHAGPFVELLQYSNHLFENAARPVHAGAASAKHLQLLFVIGDGRIDRGELHAPQQLPPCFGGCHVFAVLGHAQCVLTRVRWSGVFRPIEVRAAHPAGRGARADVCDDSNRHTGDRGACVPTPPQAAGSRLTPPNTH